MELHWKKWDELSTFKKSLVVALFVAFIVIDIYLVINHEQFANTWKTVTYTSGCVQKFKNDIPVGDLCMETKLKMNMIKVSSYVGDINWTQLQ